MYVRSSPTYRKEHTPTTRRGQPFFWFHPVQQHPILDLSKNFQFHVYSSRSWVRRVAKMPNGFAAGVHGADKHVNCARWTQGKLFAACPLPAVGTARAQYIVAHERRNCRATYPTVTVVRILRTSAHICLCCRTTYSMPPLGR